jgi:hypothetical protein
VPNGKPCRSNTTNDNTEDQGGGGLMLILDVSP